MGRRDKLTSERQSIIVAALERGHYARTACAVAGITERTYYRWLKRGGTAREAKYCRFCQAVREAEAKSEHIALAAIQRQILKGDIRAATWFLEHRYPSRWGRAVTDLTGTDGSPIGMKTPLVIIQGSDPRRLPVEGPEK